MRFLHVVHDRETKPGPALIGDAILEQGHEVEVWDIDREGRVPDGYLAFDGVVVYGGMQDVGQYDRHPWLKDEETMLRELVAAAVPVLAICLGAQQLAIALGGRVEPLREPEIGWRRVSLTQEAAQDPLFAGLPPTVDAVEWHAYDFLLPPGATLLASDSACAQAYRRGSAWGVQFHPEVTGEILERWAKAGWLGFAEGDPEVADRPDERELLRAWNLVGHHLAEAFVAYCGRPTTS